MHQTTYLSCIYHETCVIFLQEVTIHETAFFWLLYSLCCLHHPVLLLLCILSLFSFSSSFSFPFSTARNMLVGEKTLGFPILWSSGYPLKGPYLNFQTCSITWASLLWIYPIFLLLSNTLNLEDEGTQISFCALQPLSFLPNPNPRACLGWRKLTFYHMLSFCYQWLVWKFYIQTSKSFFLVHEENFWNLEIPFVLSKFCASGCVMSPKWFQLNHDFSVLASICPPLKLIDLITREP